MNSTTSSRPITRRTILVAPRAATNTITAARTVARPVATTTRTVEERILAAIDATPATIADETAPWLVPGMEVCSIDGITLVADETAPWDT
ncbi:hypothetical protein GGI17_001781, partial [Coemansia sp. S146]